MRLMIWWWMSNESLQLFYILDSFFLSLLHNKFWISWLFHPTSQNKTKFLFCFLLVFLQGWLYLATTNKAHGNFLSAGLLQFCTHWVEAWNLIIAGIYDFHKLWKRASIIIIIIIIFFMPTWFFHWHFHPKKKKKKKKKKTE
jgi:hypothetical protein